MIDSSSDAFRLDGCAAAVVGATGEIGRTCCHVMVRRGAVVLPCGRDDGRLRELFPGQRTVRLDLQDPQSLTQWAESMPLLHGVVFASGISMVRPFTMLGESHWRHIMRVNVEGPLLATRELLRARKLAAGASIVYFGSIAARRSNAGYAGYSASKAALTAGARSLACELAGMSIRVNVLAPGLVATRMADDLACLQTTAERENYAAQYPLGPGFTDDVAMAAAFLLAPASRWITGTEILIDGGNNLR